MILDGEIYKDVLLILRLNFHSVQISLHMDPLKEKNLKKTERILLDNHTVPISHKEFLSLIQKKTINFYHKDTTKSTKLGEKKH